MILKRYIWTPYKQALYAFKEAPGTCIWALLTLVCLVKMAWL